MRFRSQYEHAIYTVRPAHRVMVGVHAQNVPGIRAEFRRNVFDSEVAQGAYRWSDEDRIEVEEYLQAHPDFGTSLQLDSPAAAAAPIVPDAGCLFAIPIDGGVEFCGAPRSGEGEVYCAQHLASFTPVQLVGDAAGIFDPAEPHPVAPELSGELPPAPAEVS